MTRSLRRLLRRVRLPWVVFALVGCSGPPEVAIETETPACESDGWVVAKWSTGCVEICAPEFYYFGECEDPEVWRECTVLRSGQSAHVVKQGSLPFAELELFEERECR